MKVFVPLTKDYLTKEYLMNNPHAHGHNMKKA